MPERRVLGVIPARMSATRFPGKPLALLAGRPLIQWVFEGSRAARAIDELVVATPDVEVLRAVEAFGGTAVLTSADHETGTDRVAEVAAEREDVDLVVNIQGDQPFVTGEILDALISPFHDDPSVQMSTVAAPMTDQARAAGSNSVRVVTDQRSDALYFSRAAIPHRRAPDGGDVPDLHHIGLYAFTRGFLGLLSRLQPTPLEAIEGLEQLRVLEHGHRVRVVRIAGSILEVNTPEDLEVAQREMSGGRR